MTDDDSGTGKWVRARAVAAEEEAMQAEYVHKRGPALIASQMPGER